VVQEDVASLSNIAASTVRIEHDNLKHILPVLGRVMLHDMQAEDVTRYQQHRISEGAATKTVNLEVGTLRAILKRNKVWARIQPDIRMFPETENIGRAINEEEEDKLLRACLHSRSRSLYPAIVLALSTCMRYSEIRGLCWAQVNLESAFVEVGKSKTQSGTNRVIPLNTRASAALKVWADQFPHRRSEHFVFPSERYGAARDGFSGSAYNTNPERPIRSWKVAWIAAKKRAGVKCRFHDLRHTGCTRMLEGGVPYPVVASVMGWSPATAARMAKRYGHIGQKAYRQAVELLNGNKTPLVSFENLPEKGLTSKQEIQ